MDDYGINISDLYRLTGISRSTLTPMVNNPESVSSLKIDILDTLCDFFGVRIEDLITFKSAKSKYTVIKYWPVNEQNIAYVDMQKELGSNNRHSILGIKYENTKYLSKDGAEISTEFNVEISALTKEQIKKIGLNKSKGFPNEKELVDASLFFNDFKKQPRPIRVQTTRIILSDIIDDHFKKKFSNPSGIYCYWSPKTFFDTSNTFIFRIDKNWNLIPEDNTNG